MSLSGVTDLESAKKGTGEGEAGDGEEVKECKWRVSDTARET